MWSIHHHAPLSRQSDAHAKCGVFVIIMFTSIAPGCPAHTLRGHASLLSLIMFVEVLFFLQLGQILIFRRIFESPTSWPFRNTELMGRGRTKQSTQQSQRQTNAAHAPWSEQHMYMLAAALLLICILAAVTRANEEHPAWFYVSEWQQAVHVVTPTKREILKNFMSGAQPAQTNEKMSGKEFRARQVYIL